jgi:hypothetical protein
MPMHITDLLMTFGIAAIGLLIMYFGKEKAK